MPTADNWHNTRFECARKRIEQRCSGQRPLWSDCDIILAEIDRLRAELATVTAERDDSVKRLQFTSNANIDMAQYYDKYNALRRAHTWTDATSATMPPVGSGPWLVEDGETGRIEPLWSGMGFDFHAERMKDGGVSLTYDRDKPVPVWQDKNGVGNRFIKNTRFAAMPTEPEST